VVRDSSQITGRASVAIRSSGPDAASATASVRCSASRFGASSPSTSDTYEMRIVIPMNASVCASRSGIPQRTNWSPSGSASVAAPNAAEKNPASVTPTCTAARNRLGSPTSLASRSPRAPCSVSDLTWLSRSETSAISAAEKQPPSSTKRSTSRASTQVPLTRVSVRSRRMGTP